MSHRRTRRAIGRTGVSSARLEPELVHTQHDESMFHSSTVCPLQSYWRSLCRIGHARSQLNRRTSTMKLRNAGLLVLLLVAAIVGLMPARTTVHRPAPARLLSRDLFENFQASRSSGVDARDRARRPGGRRGARARSITCACSSASRSGIVIEATPAQLDELSADAASPDLSGDLPVSDFMAVSNQSTAPTRTRAGKAGGASSISAPELSRPRRARGSSWPCSIPASPRTRRWPAA